MAELVQDIRARIKADHGDRWKVWDTRWPELREFPSDVFIEVAARGGSPLHLLGGVPKADMHVVVLVVPTEGVARGMPREAREAVFAAVQSIEKMANSWQPSGRSLAQGPRPDPTDPNAPQPPPDTWYSDVRCEQEPQFVEINPQGRSQYEAVMILTKER